jgi:elongation factor P
MDPAATLVAVGRFPSAVPLPLASFQPTANQLTAKAGRVYDTSDIRKGLKIVIDGVPYTVVDFQFVKPGKGNAFTRTKIKNLMTGAVIDRTYKTGEKLEEADLEDRPMQYLYKDDEGFHFMDQQSYEQVRVPKEVVGDDQDFLLENTVLNVLMFQGRPVSIALPNFVEIAVEHTDPGLKGDTLTGATKQARLVTGGAINVPLFVETGDTIKIDTRTREYVERTNK